jgi:hypothetical protein
MTVAGIIIAAALIATLLAVVVRASGVASQALGPVLAELTGDQSARAWHVECV